MYLGLNIPIIFKIHFVSMLYTLFWPYIDMVGRNLNITIIGGFTSFSMKSRMQQGILHGLEDSDFLYF